MSRPFSVQTTISVTTAGTQPLLTAVQLRSLARRTLRTIHCSRPIELSVAFVDRRQSQRLNRQYRHRNRPTNVLSFPLSSVTHGKTLRGTVIVGEILLCSPVIREEARRERIPAARHAERLFVHGMLHLLGFHHATEGKFRAMQRAEVAILGDWIL